MSVWSCPNPNCKFSKELQPNQVCPLCGESAEKFNPADAHDLIKQKTQEIEHLANRVKYCPRCGSTKVFWRGGLPQIWSVWECKNCGYAGALILEDGTLGQKLQDEWQKAVKP